MGALQSWHLAPWLSLGSFHLYNRRNSAGVQGLGFLDFCWAHFGSNVFIDIGCDLMRSNHSWQRGVAKTRCFTRVLEQQTIFLGKPPPTGSKLWNKNNSPQLLFGVFFSRKKSSHGFGKIGPHGPHRPPPGIRPRPSLSEAMAQPSGSLGFVPSAPRSVAAALPWSPRDISLDTLRIQVGGLKGTWGVSCLWVKVEDEFLEVWNGSWIFLRIFL